MNTVMNTQLIALTTGLLLLTAVGQLWLRSVVGSVLLLVVQGAALAGLVVTVGFGEHGVEAAVMAGVIVALKAGFLPWALRRTALHTRVADGLDPGAKPTRDLLSAIVLVSVAYVVSQSIAHGDAAHRALPIGFALILLGFQMLLTRRTAVSQLVGFLILDNGISTIAVLSSGGLPLIVEIGVLVDVLLVVLILRVLTVRMRSETGGTSLAELRELHD